MAVCLRLHFNGVGEGMKITIVCLLLFFSITELFAQSDSTATDSSGAVRHHVQRGRTIIAHQHEHKGFFGRLGENIVLQAEAPFTMTEKQAMWVAGGTAITIGLISIDDKVDRDYFKNMGRKNRYIRNQSRFITELGGKYGIGGSLIFSVYSFTLGGKKEQETSRLLAEALITSGLWVRVGKLIFGRERPSAAYEFSHERGGRWNGAFQQTKIFRGESVTRFDAFPSGHTATAFAIATVFAEQYSNIKVVPYIAYTTASIVGVTRMIEHTHWASDVFAGGVLGYLCAQQVVANFRENYSDETVKTNLSLGILDNGTPAITYSVVW